MDMTSFESSAENVVERIRPQIEDAKRRLGRLDGQIAGFIREHPPPACWARSRWATSWRASREAGAETMIAVEAAPDMLGAGTLEEILDIEGRLRRNPYGMVAGALAVGFVLGGGLFTRLTARIAAPACASVWRRLGRCFNSSCSRQRGKRRKRKGE